MSFDLKVNNKLLSSNENLLSGSQILILAGYVPVEDFDLYKKLKGNEFEPIQLEEKVDLKEPGIESFKVELRKTLTFKVDDEEYPTNYLEMTPIDIFKIIGLDPKKFYLKQILGHMDVTYKNDETKSIDMIGNPKFITCKREPTTVS